MKPEKRQKCSRRTRNKTFSSLAFDSLRWAHLAVLYGGLVATGLNNVLMARANKALGPTVANLYMPLQPVTTAIIDYLTLGDAFYAANVVRARHGYPYGGCGARAADRAAAAAAAEEEFFSKVGFQQRVTALCVACV